MSLLRRRATTIQTNTNNPTKRQKIDHLAPIAFGRIQTTLGRTKTSGIKILLDTGSTESHVKRTFVRKLRLQNDSAAVWNTAAGRISTNEKCKLRFALPEFFPTKSIEWEMHVGTLENIHYDMIIGNDLLECLKFDIKYSTATIEWDGAEIPMRSRDSTIEDSYLITDSPSLQEAADRIKSILDAKYEPANLDEIAKSCSHLTQAKQLKLKTLLEKYRTLFDGSLGTWVGDPYEIELRSDATPYHARAFPIPRIHEQTLRHEVERLCQIGVLRRVNRSEWAAPTFIVPKKDGSVRFISDFRELNKRIKRKPYPIPKIQDLLLKL
jgi:hypothetical protein